MRLKGRTVRRTLCGEEVEVPLALLAAVRAGDRLLKATVAILVLWLFVEIATGFLGGAVERAVR